MLGGRWRFAIAIGVAALVAIAIGGFLWNEASTLQSEYEAGAKQYAEAYRDSTRIHAEQTCALVPAPDRYKCVHDEQHASRERQRQEYDLQAQLVTSAWTRAMGLAAIVAMVVGIVGVGLVYATFHETRRTANEAKRSADAFIDAERPHIRVYPGVFSLSQAADTHEMSIEVRVENYGASEAILTEFEWADREEEAFPVSDPTRMKFFAGRKIKTESISLTKLVIARRPCFVGGRAIFTSRFRPDHIAHFLWEVVPMEGGSLKLRIIQPDERKHWPKDR